MRPLIGIPPCTDDRGRWRSGRTYHYIDTAYAQALERAGALAVYLAAPADPRALVERIDGLLLPGGDDFAPPAPYPAGVRFDLTPADQLAFDRALLAEARHRGLPVLGICYGAQLLVLSEGGALHYDIATDVPDAGTHELGLDGRHGLAIEPGTRLADILGGDPGPVNSLHHQGIADPGPRLRASAWAEDGTIEAVESLDASFCIGVQWHPEKLDGSHGDALYRALAEAAAPKRAR